LRAGEKEDYMRADEKLMYGKMLELVNGQDPALASNAAMNLVAALIVGISPSLAEADVAAEYAARQIAEMVKAHWRTKHEQGQAANLYSASF
jgi:hypothetical protein